MKKHPDIHDALQSSIRVYKSCLRELQQTMMSAAGATAGVPCHSCAIEQLKTQTFESLSAALYHLGLASVDWIAARPELGMLKGIIQPAFSAASQYRQMNVDGVGINPTDAPFVSGLASRLSVDPKEIYRETRAKISALELAYWTITEKSPEPQITP